MNLCILISQRWNFHFVFIESNSLKLKSELCFSLWCGLSFKASKTWFPRTLNFLWVFRFRTYHSLIVTTVHIFSILKGLFIYYFYYLLVALYIWKSYKVAKRIVCFDILVIFFSKFTLKRKQGISLIIEPSVLL